MKRTPVLLLAAALMLTACTDQPLPEQPETSVATGPATSPTPVTDDSIAASIAEILEDPDSSDLSVGDDALKATTALFLADGNHDRAECATMIESVPEVAAFGQVTNDNDADAQDTQSLAGFGFSTKDQAADFTVQFQDFVRTCAASEPTVQPLTHHTDESFEVQVDGSNDTASSVVVLRDEDIVLMASSTPPSDVALSLTLADQLQEMLR